MGYQRFGLITVDLTKTHDHLLLSVSPAQPVPRSKEVEPISRNFFDPREDRREKQLQAASLEALALLIFCLFVFSSVISS